MVYLCDTKPKLKALCGMKVKLKTHLESFDLFLEASNEARKMLEDALNMEQAFAVAAFYKVQQELYSNKIREEYAKIGKEHIEICKED